MRIARWFLTLAVPLALNAQAVAQERLQAGVLECDVSGGFGLILGSQRTVSCTFTPASPGPIEFYTGTINKFGLDIGATSAGLMEWAVFGPSSGIVGALAGIYAGAGADASLVTGVGANALVGGSGGIVVLQPISVQGQLGVNIAAGIAELELRFMR